MKKLAVFASGTGSNFVAIHDAILQKELDAEISIVVSDRPKSKVLKHAKDRQIDTFSFTAKDYQNKEDFEHQILKVLIDKEVDLIVLAGYMRLIGPTLLNKYEKRILNIHPSLLPLYKGKDAVGQALFEGATQTGVTVHYVDSGMDTGQIIEQQSLVIFPNENRESLETRIHHIEHKLYKEVIKKVLKEMV
jgi:phosphoribosylglycinamide formyltransferase-1